MRSDINNGSRPVVWYMAQGYSIRGGHEAHLLHYATELRQHGFDTRVVVVNALPEPEHLFIRQLRQRGIALSSLTDGVSGATSRLYRMAVPWWRVWHAARRCPVRGRDLRNYIAERLVARSMRRRMKSERPAVIHVLGRLQESLWDALPPERCVLHYGTAGHVDDTWDANELERFRLFASQAALNLAPGKGVAENVRGSFGIDRKILSVFTICPDVAPESLVARLQCAAVPPHDERTKPRPLRFGVLCRFTREKGIGSILEALKVYHDKHGHVDFLFAGTGELESTIREFTTANRLTNVRMMTRFESPVEALSEMDVFVHPSISDAMPMAVAEALMCGKPCVVSTVGGMPDLVRDGREGLVIEPGRAEAIVHAMERFAAMSEAERFGYERRARERYEAACLPDRVGPMVAGLYRELIGEVGIGELQT